MKRSTWRLGLLVVSFAVSQLGCLNQLPGECPFQINLLDGGTATEVRGCTMKSPYDCAAELADGGMTPNWKEFCER